MGEKMPFSITGQAVSHHKQTAVASLPKVSSNQFLRAETLAREKVMQTKLPTIIDKNSNKANFQTINTQFPNTFPYKENQVIPSTRSRITDERRFRPAPGLPANPGLSVNPANPSAVVDYPTRDKLYSAEAVGRKKLYELPSLESPEISSEAVKREKPSDSQALTSGETGSHATLDSLNKDLNQVKLSSAEAVQKERLTNIHELAQDEVRSSARSNVNLAIPTAVLGHHQLSSNQMVPMTDSGKKLSSIPWKKDNETNQSKTEARDCFKISPF